MNDPNMTIDGFTFNLYGAILLVLLLVFVFGMWRAQRAGHLNWVDMITHDGTKVSATKVLQLVGGIVGTWIMVQLTLQGKITWDLFAIYLGYVASIDGFSKLVMAKYGVRSPEDNSQQLYSAQYQAPQFQQYQPPPQYVPPPVEQQMNGAAKTPE